MEKRGGGPEYRSQSSYCLGWAPRCPLFCARRGGGMLLSPFVLRRAQRGDQPQFDLCMQLPPRQSLLSIRALPLTAPVHGVARTAAGASRDPVGQESGPGSSDTSPELRRSAQGTAFLPRPHLDVLFAGCGAELF
ncbi:hypothetical protein NDU88_003100 [Pleurodeles waltl]|uniref:Uncharacterized protein n=1 Tax=Pleurodeles waltl TaxID=8319 RepID=A0AAV7P8Y0_PLEWA|nr:hypothetical protein NDU88_003100 [Pleurodeles waltl]